MLIMAFFAWWYGRGWRFQIEQIKLSLLRTSDTFSIPLLIKTLFAPFRQISASESGRSLDEKFRAVLDKLFSRCIGFIMRTFMIIFGLFVILLLLIISLLRLILWPIMPLMPVAGVILIVMVGTPWI
ncbi:MAG: hypothetical protein LBE03_01900 [Candidatus Nomurabacteria bacterium]|nr:hypothetical protein [Candidatus Nomurabacteria bacterium]